jgi:hypothetical protein
MIQKFILSNLMWRRLQVAPAVTALMVMIALAWNWAVAASAQAVDMGQSFNVAQAADWQADIEVKKTAPGRKTDKPAPAKPAGNTTVIERAGDAAASGQALVKLVALLTADGQEIDEGLVWRVYQSGDASDQKSKLLTEKREASPALKLQPGDYTVNASFGRANLTRRLSVKAGTTATEKFVLNAGGLRVTASLSGKPAPDSSVTYAIYADDREQFSERTAVMTGAKPGLIIRLNAGIYHIVSTYGDANAKVSADVTVEAGKLTEAAIIHQAAKAAFKLVTRAGGEALPDTHWTIQTPAGELIKESVGALPTHTLAPGDYTVLAKAGGRIFKRTFSLKDGEVANVEVLTARTDAAPDGAMDGDVRNP